MKREANSIHVENTKKKQSGAQKFPNLEVGVSMEYLCVLKKVSLSHGKKRHLEFSNSFSHSTLSYPLSFVYISHNNT